MSRGRSTDRPRLAAGLELIGRYEGSGLKEPPFLVRRSDGQVVQLSRLLYSVAANMDGSRDVDEIARLVALEEGRDIDGADVSFLIEEKLEPAGLIDRTGEQVVRPRAVPFLGLRLRKSVLPARLVNALTWIFRPFFLAPVVAIVLGAFTALDIWLFFEHGTAQPIRHVIYDPAFVVLVFGLTVVSALFHEFGHATACRFSGGRPGVMGIGLYLVWPAFFTDVTDAYRLDRAGRLRTDLGGVYFNAIFSLGTAAAYFITGFEALLVVVLLQHVQMLYQFLPFLRLDGYYVVADVTGVPDLFARMRPTLRSFIPGKSDPRAKELKPWVRVVVALWVVTTTAFLVYMFAAVALAIPHMAAAVTDSLGLRLSVFRASFEAGDVMGATAGALQIGALILPTIGFALVFWRLGASATKKLRAVESLPRRVVLVGVTAGAIVLGLAWAPSVRFTPIRPSERWTADEPVRVLSALASSRDVEVSAATAESSDLPHGLTMVTGTSGETDPLATSAGPTAGDREFGANRDNENGSSFTGPTPAPSESATASTSPSESPSPSETSSPSPTASPSPSESSSSSPSPSPSDP